MASDDNVYIKVEVGRNPNSGELCIMTRFDENAPNFHNDENGFSWSPTWEERQFLNEAFKMLKKQG